MSCFVEGQKVSSSGKTDAVYARLPVFDITGISNIEIIYHLLLALVESSRCSDAVFAAAVEFL